MTFVRRASISILALLAVVLATLAWRTWTFGSRQVAAPPGDVPDVDPDIAALWLAGAVTYPTVSSQEGTADAAPFRGLEAYLRQTFPAAHAAMEVTMVTPQGRLYFWRGDNPALDPILFAAHLDVVPVPDADFASWTHPPFAGVVADGHVWGRGTMDDKGNAIALLAAIDALARAGFRPARGVLVAFGYDEEIGGRAGAAEIARYLDENRIRLYAAYDEGLAITTGLTPGVSRPAAMIGISERGYVSLRLVASGEGGHSSMPPPRTAVGLLAQTIEKLQAMQSEPAIVGPVARMFEWLGPEMPLPQRIAFANLWLFEPLVLRQLTATPSGNALVRTTVAPTMLKAGIKENVLPTTAEAVVNFRLAPGDSVDALLGRVRGLIGDAPVAVTTTRGIMSDPSPEASVDAEPFRRLQLTIAQVFPDALAAPGLVLGATDGRYYTRNSPHVFRFSPMRLTASDLKRFHGIDERLGVDVFADMIRFYHRLLINSAT